MLQHVDLASAKTVKIALMLQKSSVLTTLLSVRNATKLVEYAKTQVCYSLSFLRIMRNIKFKYLSLINALTIFHIFAGSCVDKDNGITDKQGETCKWYTDSVPHIGELLCGLADDDDFSAKEACCVCGGGGDTHKPGK